MDRGDQVLIQTRKRPASSGMLEFPRRYLDLRLWLYYLVGETPRGPRGPKDPRN